MYTFLEIVVPIPLMHVNSFSHSFSVCKSHVNCKSHVMILTALTKTRFDVFRMMPTTFVYQYQYLVQYQVAYQDLFFQTAEIDFSNRRVLWRSLGTIGFREISSRDFDWYLWVRQHDRTSKHTSGISKCFFYMQTCLQYAYM